MVVVVDSRADDNVVPTDRNRIAKEIEGIAVGSGQSGPQRPACAFAGENVYNAGPFSVAVSPRRSEDGAVFADCDGIAEEAQGR